MVATAASDGGSLSTPDTAVLWNGLPSLDPGATAELTVTMRITDLTLRPFLNTAEISADSASLYDVPERADEAGRPATPDELVPDDDSAPDEDPANDVTENQTALPVERRNDPAVDEDDHEAVRWYRKAAAQSDVDKAAEALSVAAADLGLDDGRRVDLVVEDDRRIAAEVERKLSFIEAAEQAVDAALARSAGLRRSVLKAAFEGRLVEQDPAEEPASVLLERIAAERAPVTPRSRRGRAPRPTGPFAHDQTQAAPPTPSSQSSMQ